MSADDDRPDPTLFEKRPDVEQKTPGGRNRLPVGAYLGAFLALLVVLGVVLFLSASCGGAGGNGQTTGTVVLLLVGGP